MTSLSDDAAVADCAILAECCGHASGEALATKVRALLSNHPVDAQDADGRCAALMCVLKGEDSALQALLVEGSARVDLRCLIPGEALTPLAAAFSHGTPAAKSLILAASERAGLSALAAQEQRAAATSDLMNAICDRVDAADPACRETEGDEALCAAALLELLGISPAAELALETAVTQLYAGAPDVFSKAWRRRGSVAAGVDLEVLRSLQGHAEDAPLLVRMGEPYIARAAGSESWWVAPEAHRFNQLCMRPLQRVFGDAIPTEGALAAVAGLGLQVLELGCGTGYWARLLRARGVDVEAFDREPPPPAGDGAEGNESIFAQALTDIKQGSVEEAAAHPGRALLLAWPFDGSEDEGWDAEALAKYPGPCVVYVGDCAARTRAWQPGGMTSSPAFQRRLRAEFVCVRRVAVGKWAMVADELSIWRRRGMARLATEEASSADGKEDEKDDVPSTVSCRFCHNCAFDLSSAAAVAEPTQQAAVCGDTADGSSEERAWCSEQCRLHWKNTRDGCGGEPKRKAPSSGWQALVKESKDSGGAPFTFGFGL